MIELCLFGNHVRAVLRFLGGSNQPLETMVTEDHTTSNGWPFGLEVMNVRLREVESTPVIAVQPSSAFPSSSYNSFSSSELDTLSNSSFFQDHSVSLGRLIGLQPIDRRHMYFPKGIKFEGKEEIIMRGSQSEMGEENGMGMSWRICIPLVLSAVEKISQSACKSRRFKS